MSAPALLSYALTALAAIVLYETVRFFVKRWLRRRFERDLSSFLKSPDLYSQHFKFTNRLVVKQQLLGDPQVNAKIAEVAAREQRPPLEVRARVERYVDEIVPNFNLLSYYKLGYTIARAFIHLVYDPLVDTERRRLLDRLPPRASPVYVLNHRSNVDFVLLAYILAGKVSVSYAVGEWARVWPLEHLFKSFGSYLVRRGHKEDLYHKVLERYVQLTARHGVAQAIFPEGMITRDGHLLPPKLGLLQFLAGVESDPLFDRELVFVPVGVNYDWVLEDHNLVAETRGRPPKAGFWKKVQVLVTGPFVFFGLLLVNGTRFLLGRLKLHGYAGLSFGTPIVLRDWAQTHGHDLTRLGYEERKPVIHRFAAELMTEIGRVVPATPVPLVAAAILDLDAAGFSFSGLVDAAARTRRDLEAAGARVVAGERFHKFRRALVRVDAPSVVDERAPGLDEVERALQEREETESIVAFAVDVLRRNKILRGVKARYSVRAGGDAYLRYYANSLAQHLGRRFDVQEATSAATASSRERVAASQPSEPLTAGSSGAR